MRKAWFLFLLCGTAGMIVGIISFHQQDTVEAISTTICIECIGAKVVSHEIVWQKGVEIGFRKGRFDILTKEDMTSLKEGLLKGKRKITIVLFSGECEGCLFAEKLVEELSAINPSFFKIEVIKKSSEGFEEAKNKYGFSDIFPSLFVVDRYENVRENIVGVEDLKEKMIKTILHLEERG